MFNTSSTNQKVAEAIQQARVDVVPRVMVGGGGKDGSAATGSIMEGLLTLLLSEKMGTNLGNQVSLTYLRNNQEVTVQVIPRVSPPPNQGALGVGLGYGYDPITFGQAWGEALRTGFEQGTVKQTSPSNLLMENFICVQCGVQFGESAEPPSRCPICEDERQYVRHTGQEWTTLERLRTNHHNRIEDEASRLLGIGTEPEFAIGQRALLLQSPGGNLLWDCITLLDEKTATEIEARGGIRAIAISHPHYYSAMVDWAERFDTQIFLHAADREWVMRPAAAGSRIQFWEGSTLSLWDGLTLINLGGHFEGGTVLHWPKGASSKGVLLTGDIITVVQDRRYVSFLRSYPNLIPLGASAIRRIVERIEPFSFEQIYGGWWEANVLAHAQGAVTRSAERYLRWISA